ncbi:MAG: cation diffusion facilitator family transporter [Desulfomicrobium sp.]|nr:cation diffusion facilitator family transporter [Desulfomicrobium sp.]
MDNHSSCPHHHPEYCDEHGERGTRLVFWLTIITMAAEILAGWIFGSMALLADGWHMASHAGAMAVAWFAYRYARKHANNPDLIFGSGKVNALAGFASAIGLILVAVFMVGESTLRLVSPVKIFFGPAIFVAILGLVVNLVSAWLLRDADHAHSHDHNLKAAYLHVLADALTSVLAIFALLGGKFYGWNWLDPLIGIVGALVIGRWAWGLLQDTSKILLDHRTNPDLHQEIVTQMQKDSQIRVRDVSIWSVGPKRLAAHLTIEDPMPKPPEHYKNLLSQVHELNQIMVEVHACPCPAETAPICPEQP